MSDTRRTPVERIQALSATIQDADHDLRRLTAAIGYITPKDRQTRRHLDAARNGLRVIEDALLAAYASADEYAEATRRSRPV